MSILVRGPCVQRGSITLSVLWSSGLRLIKWGQLGYIKGPYILRRYDTITVKLLSDARNTKLIRQATIFLCSPVSRQKALIQTYVQVPEQDIVRRIDVLLQTYFAQLTGMEK